MKEKILMMLFSSMLLLAACKGRTTYEADSAVADRAKADSTVISQTEPKLVKTAGMGFKVKSVRQASEKIEALTAQYKGMVVHHQVNSNMSGSNDIKLSDDSVMRISAFGTTGEMTVKVPAENLETYLDSVSQLGIYVNSSQMDITDKSLDYLSAKLKMNSRKELVAKQRNGAVIIKDPSAVINLKDDLVDAQVENRKIDDAVKYSVVNLNFYQANTIIKEVIANDNPLAYNISFFKRLGLAFENGWYIFKEAIIVIADIWVFILAAAIAWWATRAYNRKVRLQPNTL